MRSNPWPDRHRRGFTLVELMVALVIGAGLLLGGRLLLEQIATAEHVIVADAASQDTALMRAQLLRSLVRNLQVGPDSTATFWGSTRAVTFTSWCVDSTAQRARCAVQLTIDTALTVATSRAPPVTLRPTVPHGEFRYLADARHGGVWYRTWGPGITAPMAIGVIVGTDTTVLRIGERG